MHAPPVRRAALVLCTRGGEVVGRLPPIPVATPWWQDVAAVADAAVGAFGQRVVALRMLNSELLRPHGGLVTYLAEIERLELRAGAALEAVDPGRDGGLDEQPLRMPYARPGGPAADLAWAEEVLRERRIEQTEASRQIRSWNLSSIWHLPTAGGSAWLKVVPPFFAHEGDMLRRLQGGPVPRLLGHDGPRVLMADIPGTDRYDADLSELLEMVSTLVAIQAAWSGREAELLAMRLPDVRGRALSAAIASVVDRRVAGLDDGARRALDGFVSGLGERWAAVAACGIPDTLVHGDFHPGNVRGDGDRLTLLDWGDCAIGQPLLDVPAFLESIPDEAADPVLEHWLGAWHVLLPGADPHRALALLRPVAAARQAVVYQHFVDHIEPVERRYHDADVIDWLRRSAALVAGESGG